MMPLPILQRYILGEIVRVFAFVLACITVLLVFVGVFQQATERGLDAAQVLRILPFIVPSLLPFTIPAAMLLTVSVVYGRLAGDLELTAAKAAGIHPVTLMWPAFVLGGFLSVGSLWLTDQVIPWSIQKIEAHVVTLVEDIFLDRLRSELQFSDPGRGLHITVAGVDGRRLIHPVFRYAKSERVVTVRAEDAYIRFDLESQEAEIAMRNGMLEISEKSGVLNRTIFRQHSEHFRWNQRSEQAKARNMPVDSIKKELVDIATSRIEEKQIQAIQAMMSLTQADFTGLVKSQTASSAGITLQERRFHKLRTEMHSRYAMACSCFFFCLIGTPFSMRFGKSQFLTSFLICFLPIVCGYYPLMIGLITQAKKGAIDPSISMWVANILLAIGGWFAARHVIRY